MKSWYYMLKNKSHGPIEKEQIIKSIQSGLLGPLDLIYQEGGNRWKTVIEHKEFQSILKNNPSHIQKEWILLIQTNERGHFRMDGPCSNFEVKKRIKEGQLKYTDYAWKSGMTEWYMISHLKSFNIQTKERITFEEEIPSFSLSLPENVSQVENVMIQKRKQKEHLIQETLTSNTNNSLSLKKIKSSKESKNQIKESEKTLAQKSSLNKDSSEASKKPSFNPLQKEKTTAHKKSLGLQSMLKALFSKPPDPSKKKRLNPIISLLFNIKTLTTLIALLIVGSVSYLVFESNFFSNKKSKLEKFFHKDKKTKSSLLAKNSKNNKNQDLKKPKKNQLTHSKEKNKKVKKPTLNTENRKKLENQKPIKLSPPDFKIMTQNLFNQNSKLIVQNKNRALKNITMTIQGKAGETINEKSIYKKFEYTNTKRVVFALNPSKFKPGGYTAMVKGENLSQEIKFFLGNKNKYKKEINRKRKKASFLSAKEKYEIFQLSSKLNNLCLELIQNASHPRFSLKTWTSYFSFWKQRFSKVTSPEIKQISWNNTSNFIYPKMWMDIKLVKKNFLNKAKEVNLKESKAQAIKELKRIQSQLKKIYLDSKRLTLYP